MDQLFQNITLNQWCSPEKGIPQRNGNNKPLISYITVTTINHAVKTGETDPNINNTRSQIICKPGTDMTIRDTTAYYKSPVTI